MKYRLALDLGATSLGWTILALDKNNEPHSLVDMGVRIYDDGRDAKSFEPMAVARRLARGARRNRDRNLARKQRLMALLVELKLFPISIDEQKSLESLDPYELRARALDEQLTPFEIGRALFHINQRRGFKSNRKSDKKSNDAGPVKKAIADLEQKMMIAGARSLGAYLNAQEAKRVRYDGKAYSLYTMRQMYVDEVKLILDKQATYYPEILTQDACAQINDIIFFQRDLHKPKIGFCTFEYEARERRAPLALPSVQNFRIWQEVNNLDLEQYTPTDPRLESEDRQKIIETLQICNKKTFKALRKVLDIDDGAKFNLEYDARTEMKGNETAAKLSNKKAFGKAWFNFDEDEQNEIVLRLLEEENEATLIVWLQDQYALSEEQAEYVSEIHLPDGYGRVSLCAINKILPHLRKGEKYHDACQSAGYHHSDFRTGEIFDHLPYYGEALQHRVIGGSLNKDDAHSPEKFYGKVGNPTVHIVMNQLQKLVNACIDKWGHPESISVELARDLKQPKDEIRKQQAKNKKDNERIVVELEKLDVKNNYANRMRYKLWEDLSREPNMRCCLFTGVTIGVSDIFSPEYEVEHLIPFSRSFDDGRANKVLAKRSANRVKGNKTPFDAFGHSPTIGGVTYNWNDIQARADQLHRSKRWRFQPDALERVEKEGGPIARQLNDTRYLSRLAREYLQYVCGPENIHSIPGRLTAFMRDKWGLNDVLSDSGKKDRADHRHHAIDAFVVGCTTRSTLQKVSGAAKKLEENEALQDKRHKIVSDMPEPYDGYLKQVQSLYDTMVVSHKPDHGNAAKAINAARPYTTGKLHEDTAYGYVGKGNKKGTSSYVVRKAVNAMTKRADVEAIRDDRIRCYLLKAVEGVKDKSKDFETALQTAAQNWSTPIYRVRTLVQKSDAVMIGIKDKKTKQPYKYYQGGGNAYTEIYEILHGKYAGKWKAETINQYDVHTPSRGRKWKMEHPTAKLVMTLHNNDMVAYDDNGETIIARVKKMSGGRVYLRDHRIANEDADKLSWAASANGLKERKARKISVDILGYIRDPQKKHTNKRSVA
ncbi:MAG: type II CRISPR RNA-guided endonuclease Cas9 [Alphaproteobacteria bacterium]|nr:MAG: type II CRISPR RNA-guided endonuclease Cas9 [Alphaproteobacteria bacterium]